MQEYFEIISKRVRADNFRRLHEQCEGQGHRKDMGTKDLEYILLQCRGNRHAYGKKLLNYTRVKISQAITGLLS